MTLGSRYPPGKADGLTGLRGRKSGIRKGKAGRDRILARRSKLPSQRGVAARTPRLTLVNRKASESPPQEYCQTFASPRDRGRPAAMYRN
jgi:hypothetical protein